MRTSICCLMIIIISICPVRINYCGYAAGKFVYNTLLLTILLLLCIFLGFLRQDSKLRNSFRRYVNQDRNTSLDTTTTTYFAFNINS